MKTTSPYEIKVVKRCPNCDWRILDKVCSGPNAEMRKLRDRADYRSEDVRMFGFFGDRYIAMALQSGIES